MLQLQNYVFPLEKISQALWSDKKISLGFWDSMKSSGIIRRTITWDGIKTTIQSASLIVSASVISYIWPGGSCGLDILVNGASVATKGWLMGDVSPYSARIDIASYLINGVNSFEVQFNKLPIVVDYRVLNVSAILEVEFTGETPVIPPPPFWEEFLQWMTENPLVVAGAAGIGMAVVGGVILIRGKKK